MDLRGCFFVVIVFINCVCISFITASQEADRYPEVGGRPFFTFIVSFTYHIISPSHCPRVLVQCGNFWSDVPKSVVMKAKVSLLCLEGNRGNSPLYSY